MKEDLNGRNREIARLQARLEMYEPFKQQFEELHQKHERVLFECKRLLLSNSELQDALQEH